MALRPRRSAVISCLAAAFVLGSCAASASGSAGDRSVDSPAADPLVVAPLDVGDATLLPSGDVDHIVLDESGVYFCVLRRPDDLADLRASFNGSG